MMPGDGCEPMMTPLSEQLQTLELYIFLLPLCKAAAAKRQIFIFRGKRYRRGFFCRLPLTTAFSIFGQVLQLTSNQRTKCSEYRSKVLYDYESILYWTLYFTHDHA